MKRRFAASFNNALAVSIGFAFLLSGCERVYTGIFGPSEEVVNAKGAFLNQNPKLKVVLSRLQNERRVHESNIADLKKIRRSFAQEGSKAMIEQKISDYTASVERLKSQISRVDEEVERGVALQKFNQMDGGGTRSPDMENLITQSMSVLGEAERQRAISSGIFRQGSQTGTRPAPLTPSPNSKSFPSVPSVSNMIEQPPVPKAQPVAEDDTTYATYTVLKTQDGFLNMRRGPGLAYPTVGRMRFGARGVQQIGETVHDTKDQIIWMPVRFGGVSGFVSSNFLKPD